MHVAIDYEQGYVIYLTNEKEVHRLLNELCDLELPDNSLLEALRRILKDMKR